MSKYVPVLAVAGGIALVSLMFAKPVSAIVPSKLYIHIKHDASGPFTLGKVQQIYSEIQAANHTGIEVGIQPQCIANWETQLAYYGECKNIPVMAQFLTPNPYGTGEPYMLSVEQIEAIRGVSDLRILSLNEAASYYRDVLNQPLPEDYIKSVFAYAKNIGVPVFWSEWDWRAYPIIADVIRGYEDTVIVSFGTNANYIEPVDAYQIFLQQFSRKGASVQSWYWWERHDRVSGTELEMPPELMIQHTSEAFAAGCEIVHYEPFGYFFDNEIPKSPLAAVLA